MHLLAAWRHYDDVNARRLCGGVVVFSGGVPAVGMGMGMGAGGGGGGSAEASPSVVYSQGGRRVVRVSI